MLVVEIESFACSSYYSFSCLVITSFLLSFCSWFSSVLFSGIISVTSALIKLTSCWTDIIQLFFAIVSSQHKSRQWPTYSVGNWQNFTHLLCYLHVIQYDKDVFDSSLAVVLYNKWIIFVCINYFVVCWKKKIVNFVICLHYSEVLAFRREARVKLTPDIV